MQRELIQRIRQIDNLIQIGGTGSTHAFAKRLAISRTTLFEYINLMKELGAPIRYCKHRETYYYETAGGLTIGFVKPRDVNLYPM